jgi:hypothetical protein
MSPASPWLDRLTAAHNGPAVTFDVVTEGLPAVARGLWYQAHLEKLHLVGVP